jgi:hypothetical protein
MSFVAWQVLRRLPKPLLLVVLIFVLAVAARARFGLADFPSSNFGVLHGECGLAPRSIDFSLRPTRTLPSGNP